MDIMTKDSLGREWQISTIQLDFNMPMRFKLEYTDADGSAKTPVMIHRALIGSPERFMGILIEHYAGAFPLWLAPEQVRIVPVAEVFVEYAKKVLEQLKSQHFRASIDEGNDSFSKKIRNAELWKVPYILIVGEKEEKAEEVSVREFKTKEQYAMGVSEFLGKIEVMRREKKL
jgi:threonyl-tRNA synthetase